jgi:hypothetical protein
MLPPPAAGHRRSGADCRPGLVPATVPEGHDADQDDWAIGDPDPASHRG